MPKLPVVDIAALGAFDIADCCASQAMVRVQMPKSGKLLDFCSHHYRKHEVTLLTQGVCVVEARHHGGKSVV